MRNNTKNRFISGLLAGVMMLNQVPVFASAEETGLCEHHTVHEDCGYVESVISCGFKCDVCIQKQGETTTPTVDASMPINGTDESELLMQEQQKETPPEEISIPETLCIGVNQVNTIRPEFTPLNATTVLRCESSNPEIVSCHLAGIGYSVNVTGKSPGTGIITIYTDNGKSASCSVTVLATGEPTEISIPQYCQLQVGQSYHIPITLLPDDAETLYSVYCSNYDIVSVNTTGSNSGVVIYGANEGVAVITVETSNGLQATCEVTVESGDEVEQVIIPGSKQLVEADTWYVPITNYPETSYTRYSISCDNSSVVRVGTTGASTGCFVQAVSEGTATITISTDNGKYASCLITVVHDFSEEIVYVDPTCTNSGGLAKKCTICGKLIITEEYQEAFGHSEEIDAAVDATCTEPGLTEGRHCSECGEVLLAQKVIPAGHKVTDGICTMCRSYGTNGTDVTWEYQDGILTISGSGQMNSFDVIAEYPWCDIHDLVHTVIIEEGITNIPKSAFHLFQNLTSIQIPNSVTSIGETAFVYCKSLTQIQIPDSVETIGSRAFDGCTALEGVRLPAKLKTVSSELFYNCNALAYAVIPNGVTTIESGAFSRCFSLDYLYLPASVTSIAGDNSNYANNTRVFDSCSENLVILCQSSAKPNGWSSYWNYISATNALQVYYGCTSQDGDFWVLGDKTNTSLRIPEGVTVVPAKAFYDRGDLTAVFLPDSLTTIGHSAFRDCENLEEIQIPQGVKTIESNTFHSCVNLQHVVIPDSLITIEKSAFMNCKALARIYIPANVYRIEESPFYGCDSSMNIYCGAEEKSIAWSEKWNYYQDYTPTLRTHFGYSREEASYWANLDVSQNKIEIPEGITRIPDYAFRGCSNIESITIPDSVISVGEYAFSGCTGLTSIHLPDSISYIGSYAFNGCTDLCQVNIPQALTDLNECVFAGCTTLEEIIFPHSLEAIRKHVFYNCTGLEKFTFLGDAPYIHEKAFYGVTATAYYPDSNPTWTSDVLQNNGGTITWVPYGIEEHIHKFGDDNLCECGMYGGTCGENLTWLLDAEGIFTISGTGSMNNYPNLNVPWSGQRNSIKKVVVEHGVTSIGDNVFAACSNLNSVTISETITAIGAYAFSGCSNLSNIVIPKSITSIGTYAFSECGSLSNITIPGNVTAISNYAFADCTSLNSITILEGVTSIGYNAFSGCCRLSSVIFPDSITSIGGGAFRDCSNLMSINIPDSVTNIGGSAFNNCGSLKNAVIGNGVTNIGDYVFSNCSSLETVTTGSDIGFMMFENCKELSHLTILDGVRRIDSCAFESCSSLVDINIPDSVTLLGSAFSGCSSLTRVIIGDGVQNIADHTFYECNNLESVKLGESITSIGQYAFYRCEKLFEVNIPNSVTRIDTCAFYGCKSLQDITIPGGVTTIEYQTFAQCENLTTLIIENGVTSIAGVAFPGCFELKCIVLPNSITSFEIGAFPVESESKREIFYGGTKEEWSALTNRPDAKYVHYSSTNPEGHWNTVNENATCSKTGYTVESCGCGYKRNEIITPATGHTEVTDPAVEPTCTTNGLTEGKYCSVCNEVILAQEEIPGGHNIVDGVCTNCGAYGGKCGDDVTWMLDTEGVLTLSGTGATYDYSGITNQVHAPWAGWREQISALVIGENISGIGKELFYNLSALREVTIPAGVQSIGARAFAGCHNLTSITVSEENGNYKSVDGVLFSKDQTVLIAMPTGYNGNYTVPDGVIDIADGAFMYCMGVTDVAFPETLRSIGEEVFFNCHSLTTLQLPVGVSEIGARAFGNCAYLTAINIPESLTEISSGLFSESGVENIVLHEGITRIADAAFWSSGLKAITIPGSVKKIENSAFSLCKDLETVVISEGVEIIDGTAFEECSALRSIVLPQSLKTIEGHAFRFCSSLTEVDIPAAVASIGYNAFSGCSSLSSITLHRGLQKIEYGAFAGTAVENITIPATVTCIEWLAFAECEKLTEITFCGNAPFFDTHNGDENMFLDVTATAYYPIDDSTWTTDVMQNYGGNITWIAYDLCGSGHSFGADHRCAVCDIIGGICGDDLTWILEEATGALTISGTGDMYDHVKSTDMPWYDFRDQITSVEVQSSATSLGMYAFEECINLKEISLPDSLTSIGVSAFLKCTSLERIVIPDSVTEIPYGLFTECSKLKEVILPEGITSIGEIAFANCSSLSHIDLPDSVTSIGVSAFVWCDSLKEIRFLGDAPVIEADTFAGVTATAYYSAGNSTWTSSVMQNYGGSITWVPYCDNSHSFGEWITEGNNSRRTCIYCGYTEHKMVTDSGDVEIEIPEQPDLEVEVDPVLPSEDNYVLVEEVLDSTGNQNQAILKVFDINLKNDGVNVQPSGTVKVKLPLDGDKDGKYKVYRVNDDGTLTDMNAYRQGNQMIFETDHFSLYVIVEETEHRHNYKPEITAPTCTESGFTIYTCDCGDTYVGDEVAALDHNVVLQKSETASCELNGFEYYACERCGGKEYTIILESTGHDYENGTCSVCGEKDPDYVKPSQPGWGNMWDWIFGNWWGQGQKCDHEYTTVITAPTCTDKGYTTYTCYKCGDCYKDSYTNALGHAWDDGTVTEEASCTENGVRTYNCGTCEKQKTETIKATGHDYVDGICGGCGAEENTKPSVPNKPTKPGFGFIFDWIFGSWWK